MPRKNWWNNYVGLPYKVKGRNRDGLDCWGLVRLVHSEQFGIELPSLSDQYDSDREQHAELIVAHKEGWEVTQCPRSGDVVLFSILGNESHVGIVTQPGYFLHVREGQDAVIERLDSSSWKHRVRGIYRYREGASELTISAQPHPLHTRRIDAAIPPGMNIGHVVDYMRQAHGIPLELAQDAVIYVDGEYIPRDKWSMTVPRPGSRVEYRAVPKGSSAGRILGTIAVMAVAWYAAPLVATSMGFAAGTTAFTVASGVASIGINMVGGLLVNSIFPVRPPSTNGGGSISGPRPIHMLQGGSNQPNRYGAIPVVLGRFRYTPPLGANSYVETGSSTSYLRMLLVWGYGPLQVSDLRIGQTPISDYQEVEHETLNGFDDTAEDKARFNSLYGVDVTQQQVGVKLALSSPVDRTLDQEVDRITVTFHFPQGLWAIDQKSGKEYYRSVSASVQVRQTINTSWSEVAQLIHGRVLNLNTAYYNIDSDAELEPVYQWTRISVDKYNQIIVRRGAFTASQYSNPTGSLLSRLQNDNFGMSATFDRLPALGPEEEALWDICVYGGAVVATVDQRGTQGLGSVTGGGLTTSGLVATIADGGITRSQVETFYVKKKTKDAFSASVTFYVPKGMYEVRTTLTSAYVGENTTYNDCYLQTITGYANNRPVVEPSGVKLAMTAIRIRATNQLNGNVEGITGTVQAICKDYDNATGTWIIRPTRNPASLLRHVLQHPANAKRLPDSYIDLVALADWHTFCRTNGFMFDMVLTGQQSVEDTLRDIAASGRASPTWVDGKRTVIIDRPRSSYAQFFTPHNSWGFEGSRSLPKLPHAFRVQFANASKGYQPDERIVYNDGYSAANATLYEGLALPGVTSSSTIFKHARFHLAQIKLRPETYTLNADIEHLVCNRGDLVRVTHDVPMWGLGTGRIKNRISGTVLELDEQVPMDAGVQYTIRIRLEDGSSVKRTVAAVGTDGYYSQITLTASVTATQGAPSNLFMFGSLNSESVELIVQSIEPAEDMTARLTLVDYSPAVYDSDTEVIPAFDSQITKPPVLIEQMVSQVPTITGIVSDESVMSRLAPGKYAYAIRVSFTNPKTLPSRVSHIEAQINPADDNTDDWLGSLMVPVSVGAVFFNEVEEAEQYKMRLRYVDEQGRTGPWVTTALHTVVGKANPPSAPTGLTYLFQDTAITTATVTLDWIDNPEPDVVKYEVSRTGRTVYVSASTFTEQAAWIGERTYSVVAIDAVENRSAATLITITKSLPGQPGRFRSNVVDNNVLLYWDAPAVTTLPVASYELRRGSTWAGAEVIGRKSGGFTSVFEMVAGTKTYWLAAIDTDNNMGSPVSLSVSVQEPPDFVLHGNFNSTLAGNLSSAILDSGGVLLPVNTTETWETHFSSRGWSSPQDQINAGYPIFIQPAAGSGYYEEQFDIGTVLASSKVTVAYAGDTVAGTPDFVPTIYTSDDGVTWSSYPGVMEVFATAFRYVKFRLTVYSADAKALYRLRSLNVRADVKLKNDAGIVSCVSTDPSGTVANFTKEFIDVASLTVTAKGTTPVTAVYDFLDDVVNGTYSVTANVATINATAHSLVVGQKVRLAFTTGSAPSGIYTVTSVINANSYTVAITTANTSGNVSTYPQGMRIYLFNSAGARVTGTASWSVKGY